MSLKFPIISKFCNQWKGEQTIFERKKTIKVIVDSSIFMIKMFVGNFTSR